MKDKVSPSSDERIGPTWRRILSQTGVRSAVYAFTLTRLIVFFIFIMATNLSFDEPLRDFGPGVQEPRISLASAGVAQKLGRAMLYADGLWYANIARDGYERQPFEASAQHTWAFFPLYPLLLRAASSITGEYALTGSLLSNLFLLFSLVLLHPLVRAFGYDEGCADRTIFYMAAFPTSYFFSLPVTESLFLLLTVGCFLAVRRKHWWLTGILGALATATRPTGILIFPALLVQYWQTYRSENLRRRELLALLLVPLGLFAFMFYLRETTGDALAFLKVQAAWGHRAGFFLRPLFDYLMNPLEVSVRWDFRLLNFAAAMVALACGLVLLKRRQWSLATYTLICVIAPLSSMALQSMSRYFLTIFPAFIMLALAGRRPLLDQSLRAIFLALLALMTALFAIHFSTAMS
ncbi:MAG TPA: mannosyltransferase family protein [Pyrinomonadaceae bacterium]|jgi:hypothetical protein|nr:mannosyltransferase family protein [Pyrinomonadaceae bacterium]